MTLHRRARRDLTHALVAACVLAAACEKPPQRGGPNWDLASSGQGGDALPEAPEGPEASPADGGTDRGGASSDGGAASEPGTAGEASAGEASGEAPEQGPCPPGAADTDEDGVCDAVDIDDDDDGYLDDDDRSASGIDTSRKPASPLGGKGNAPNAVLNEPCARKALAEANARLEELGLAVFALEVERRHWDRDASGFYARSEAHGRIVAATDGTSGETVGAEFHFVRLDGEGENDRYESSGLSTWNDEPVDGDAWLDQPVVLRGNAERYTVYSRGEGLIHIQVGSVNPATGSLVDERFLSINRGDPSCPWRLTLAPRMTRVARRELKRLCADPDARFATAPELATLDPHCARGRFAVDAADLPQLTPCDRAADHDGDGLDDCDDGDDDDDGIRDLDDRVMGGPSWALDPTRPGDELSSAPNALLNDTCVQRAIEESGWDVSQIARGHETPARGLFIADEGVNHDYLTTEGPLVPPTYYLGVELDVRQISADRYDQVLQQFSSSGAQAPYFQRSVIVRGAAGRYARFKRYPDLALVSQGVVDEEGVFRGEYMVVSAPRRSQGPCPPPTSHWTLGRDAYRRAEPSEFRHTCVDEGRMRLVGDDWFRADGSHCDCRQGPAIVCAPQPAAGSARILGRRSLRTGTLAARDSIAPKAPDPSLR